MIRRVLHGINYRAKPIADLLGKQTQVVAVNYLHRDNQIDRGIINLSIMPAAGLNLTAGTILSARPRRDTRYTCLEVIFHRYAIPDDLWFPKDPSKELRLAVYSGLLIGIAHYGDRSRSSRSFRSRYSSVESTPSA